MNPIYDTKWTNPVQNRATILNQLLIIEQYKDRVQKYLKTHPLM